MISLVGKQIPYAGQIMQMWGQGLDTVQIAQRLCLPEHVVANALARARDKGRPQ